MAVPMEVEQALLRVPLEQVSTLFRNKQKLIDKEITSIVGEVAELTKTKGVQASVASEKLQTLVGKLQGLKRKLSEANLAEEEQMNNVRLRIEHLREAKQLSEASPERFFMQRMDRFLTDYFLREGMYESAQQLALDGGIQPLVDTDLFLKIAPVLGALSRGDCSLALTWCAENRSRLKKIESPLEFQLRVQEFVEYIRKDKLTTAIKYARRFLAPSVDVYMTDIQVVMALLAFPGGKTTSQRYQKYFADTRLAELCQQLKTDFYAINNCTSEPMLTVSLQAGLSSLKTTLCYCKETRNLNCPACAEEMRELAAHIPFSQRNRSCLVCRISGDLMNEDNPPLVLPNGSVYSQRALTEMANASGGTITCPRTGLVCTLDDCKKAFVA